MTTTQGTDTGSPPRARRVGVWAGLVGISCCIYPTVLALLGLATATEAIALGTKLYGEYAWAFRGAGLAFAIAGIVVMLRRRGECTVAGASRHRVYIGRVLLIAVVVYWFFYGVTKALEIAAS